VLSRITDLEDERSARSAIDGVGVAQGGGASAAADPTSYWRRFAAHQFNHDRMTAVRAFVLHAAPLWSPRWRHAARAMRLRP
jgi:hypothetical protein